MKMPTLDYLDLKNTVVDSEFCHTHAFVVYCACGVLTGRMRCRIWMKWARSLFVLIDKDLRSKFELTSDA